MQFYEISEKQEQMNKEYRELKREKLLTLLSECGLNEVDVFYKNIKGRVIVREINLSTNYEYAFYPYTKNNTLSSKAKYSGYINLYGTDNEIKKQLIEKFDLKGV